MAGASRHRRVTGKKVWKTDSKVEELYWGERSCAFLVRNTAGKVHTRASLSTLIPVLVRGIRPTRVCVAEILIPAQGLGLAGSL
ncbi:hypothetical protein X971_4370 [Agrobacterium tumefaciens LBA4213 (Ach5)]|nr:hypothetical protein X971_4370 [Agrobacterium tumefaciens LBA4213 (Ach5)]